MSTFAFIYERGNVPHTITMAVEPPESDVGYSGALYVSEVDGCGDLPDWTDGEAADIEAGALDHLRMLASADDVLREDAA